EIGGHGRLAATALRIGDEYRSHRSRSRRAVDGRLSASGPPILPGLRGGDRAFLDAVRVARPAAGSACDAVLAPKRASRGRQWERNRVSKGGRCSRALIACEPPPRRLLERDLRPHRPRALVLRDELDRPTRRRPHHPFHLRAVLGRVATPAGPAARHGWL